MNRKTLAYLLIFFTLLVWGTSFLATKLLLVVFTPIEIILVRYSIAFVTLLLIHPRLLGWTSWRHELLFFLAGITGTSIYSFLENSALIYTSASNVSIIVTTSVFFSGVIAHFLLPNEHVRPIFYAGFAVSIVGIALISFNGQINLQLSPMGDILAVIAAVSWGFYSSIIKMIGKLKYHPIQVTRRIMMYGVLSFIPVFSMTSAGFDWTRFQSLDTIIYFLALGVFSSAFTLYAWNQAVHQLGVVKTSLFLYLVPVITIVAASLFIREPITWMGMLGALITLAGLYVSMLQPKVDDIELDDNENPPQSM